MPKDAIAAVLVAQRAGGYKDVPGIRYHFPNQRYLKKVQGLLGCLALFYEPRRGGSSANTGGRQGFTSLAYLTDVWPDPDDETHSFVGLRYYFEFLRVVPLARTSLSPRSMQNAVRTVAMDEAEQVVREGLSEANWTAPQRQGFIDIDDLVGLEHRETRQVISDMKVRDAAFRYRVVEVAYAGRCALTGLRVTNGLGRAEVDAAHIRPVVAEGPDSVRNGIALSKTMHWAFDRGLVSLADDGKILTVARGLEDAFHRLLLPAGRAALPGPADQRPHHAFLSWHREHVFKGET